MPSNDFQFDDADGTSSLASFEDVGGPTKSSSTRDLIVLDPRFKMKAGKPIEVPDIRYILQYKNAQGNIINSRESDQPFDLTGDTPNGADDTATTKSVLEIVTTVQTIRRSHRHDTFDDSTGSDSDSEEEDISSPPIVHFDQDGTSYKEIEKAKMIIRSRPLISALNAVIGASYPGTNLLLRDVVTISAPYEPLVHHRDALSRYRIAQPACHGDEYARTTAQHIDVLLAYLEKTCGARIREEEARYARSPPVATFGWLWLLLKPGEVVYRRIQDVWTAFVIDHITTWPSHKGPEQYQITCWDIRYNQGRMRRCFNQFIVPAFPGEQAIKTLGVVPAAFFPEDLQKQGGLLMAEKQIQMGRSYWELVKRPAYRECDGQLVDRDGLRAGHLTGRVVVDAEGYDRFASQAPDRPGMKIPPPARVGNHSFNRRHPPPPMPAPQMMPQNMAPGQVPMPMAALPQFSPQCSCDACLKGNPDRTVPGPLANLEDLNPLEDQLPKNDLFFLACSPHIPAFILRDRHWGHVGLDSLSEVKCDTESFKYLVLDPGVKLTVKALIGKFASADGKVSPWPNDFVRNKGEGRIFLLHGSPGVGKTCTAECVAELARRPLLSITSGDLVPPVERSLGYFLTLGERYGALVLLDEADVYLEARRTRDVRRNALVSVFLRALEYYRGVLFLTTNRVESFDPAFTSRIHVALHYRQLSGADRARIWANNFDRLERDSAGKVFVAPSAREYILERDIDREAGFVGEVGQLRWNGREIRNALQTAVALAETEAVEEGLERVGVAERHLKQVVKMSRGFKEFLRKRRGYDQDDEDTSSEDQEHDEGSDDDDDCP